MLASHNSVNVFSLQLEIEKKSVWIASSTEDFTNINKKNINGTVSQYVEQKVERREITTAKTIIVFFFLYRLI